MTSTSSQNQTCPRCGAIRASYQELFCSCGYQWLDATQELDRMLETINVDTKGSVSAPLSTSNHTVSVNQPGVLFESSNVYQINQRCRLNYRLIYPAGSQRTAMIIHRLEGEGMGISQLMPAEVGQLQLSPEGGEVKFGVPFRAIETGDFTVSQLQITITNDHNPTLMEVYELADQSIGFIVQDTLHQAPEVRHINIHTAGDVIGTDINIDNNKKSSDETQWLPIELRKVNASIKPTQPAEDPALSQPIVEGLSNHNSPNPANTPTYTSRYERSVNSLIEDAGRQSSFVTKLSLRLPGTTDQPNNLSNDETDLTIGSSFILDVYSDEPAFMTLIDVGTSGSITLLTHQIPIPAHREVSLTGPVSGQQWQAGGPPGQEWLLAWFTLEKHPLFPNTNAPAKLGQFPTSHNLASMLATPATLTQAVQLLRLPNSGGYSAASLLINIK